MVFFHFLFFFSLPRPKPLLLKNRILFFFCGKNWRCDIKQKRRHFWLFGGKTTKLWFNRNSYTYSTHDVLVKLRFNFFAYYINICFLPIKKAAVWIVIDLPKAGRFLVSINLRVRTTWGAPICPTQIPTFQDSQKFQHCFMARLLKFRHDSFLMEVGHFGGLKSKFWNKFI